MNRDMMMMRMMIFETPVLNGHLINLLKPDFWWVNGPVSYPESNNYPQQSPKRELLVSVNVNHNAMCAEQKYNEQLAVDVADDRW